MKAHFLAVAVVIAWLATTPALAQYPMGAVGFYIQSSTGNSAGSACWWFSCTAAPISVTANEVLTLKISGEWQAQYLLAGSSSATSCVALSGILHNLVLDAPIVLLGTGTLSSASPVLACPYGYTNVVAAVPVGIPLGTTIAIQALTFGAGNVLALTGAIVLTIV